MSRVRRASRREKAWTFSIAGFAGAIALVSTMMPSVWARTKGHLAFYQSSTDPYVVVNPTHWKNYLFSLPKNALTDLKAMVDEPIEKGIVLGLTALGVGIAVRGVRKLKIPSVRFWRLRVKAA